MSERGLFITLEGLDGVGKSTQMRLLAEALTARGRTVKLTEEPRGTVLGEALDRLIKEPAATAPTARAEALLFLAARAQHVDTVVRPALAAGEVVVCSRFSHSTLAYQCAGLGLDEDAVRAADAFARDGLWPDAVLVFEAPAAAVASRLAERAGDDRIEARAADYQRRVGEGFRRLVAAEPERCRLIAGEGSPADVHAAVMAALEPWL